ncbi:hypothetical protein AB6B38_09600 [Glycocaulis abyssi]|uniref:Novel STAND NTPase 1 domain-containing protein n=1 Tax=Glycocaulis abyssi TaxID=1433403 RepID=A0ABV9ND49_9PROT
MSVTAGSNLIPDETPYPGLRYYEPGFSALFAGRDNETGAFIDTLLTSNVLLLHGRSGCGKSSFLRAGVKPALEHGTYGVGFPTVFNVIRSGQYPLREFVDYMFEVVDSIAAGETKFGQLRGIEPDHEAFRQSFDKFRELEERLYETPHPAFEMLNLIGRSLEVAPIFVIDQAEEVFTLREKRLAQEDDTRDRKKIAADERQFSAYFEFLGHLCRKRSNCRIVISLRTEYKGRFDDELSRGSGPAERLRGFFLSDLDRGGILSAIERPTQPEAAEGGAFHPFYFEDGVAEALADEMANSEVPAGGVLPTLQVTCRRLWRMAKAARPKHLLYREKSALRFPITLQHVRQIGNISTQIEEYVSESIEAACQNPGNQDADNQKPVKWPEHISYAEAADLLHRMLASELVKVEADGRAVTRRVERDKLVENAKHLVTGHDENDNNPVGAVIDALCDEPYCVLRREGNAIMLGHDSVALALHKWNLVFNRSPMTMMRMSMRSAKGVRELEAEDLYPEGEQPAETRIVMVEDFFWDRQIPAFAEAHGFSKRLNFTFADDPALSSVRGSHEDKKAPKSWPELRDRIVQRRRKNDNGDLRADELLLVPAEWSSFPGSKDKEFQRIDEARHWSDVLITNLFVGNSLIGPADPRIEEIHKKIWKAQSTHQSGESLPSLFHELIEQSLAVIVEKAESIRAYGEAGRNFLQSAARIANYNGDLEGKLNKAFESLQSSTFQVNDPLIGVLLKNLDEGAGPRFVVGSASTRAVARQSGFVVYFGCEHLMTLVREEMSSRVAGDRRIYGLEVDDIAAEMQSVIGHTAWQLSVPAALWKQGTNRGLVLRLAAIGYFTVEQMRTSMDDFVLHVHREVNEMRSEAKDRQDLSVKGLRISRKEVRRAIQESYDFLKFDEYALDFYDFDSPRAYWSDHALAGSRSVAGEIYNELVSLRRATLDHFSRIAECASWLRYRNAYNPADPHIARGFELKQYGWNHFKIMNFYDSERYMARAAAEFDAAMHALTK